MHRSRSFHQGEGGGGPGPSERKTSDVSNPQLILKRGGGGGGDPIAYSL